MAAAAYRSNFVPDHGLTPFLQKIRTYPILPSDEETALARRVRDLGDDRAVERLATSHMRLVVKIAMGYRGYGLPVADLISEGNIGLIQAIRRFDPERGFRLSTYAMWWIRAAIQEHILHSWSLVKMGTTAAQKKLFFNLRRIKGQMKALEEGDLRPDQVAAIAVQLDVPEQEVVDMNRRLARSDQSLNAAIREDGEGEWQDWLTDTRESQEVIVAENQETARRRTFLSGALDRLSQRERHILAERHLKETPATLQDLSEHYGISRERIRQIETRAFQKLRKCAAQSDLSVRH